MGQAGYGSTHYHKINVLKSNIWEQIIPQEACHMSLPSASLLSDIFTYRFSFFVSELEKNPTL